MGCGKSTPANPTVGGAGELPANQRYVPGPTLERRSSFAECHEGTQKGSGMKVVIREFPKVHPRFEQAPVMAELNQVKLLDHPSILKVYDTWEDDDAIHFAEEFTNGGELLEAITSWESSFCEQHAVALLKQVLEGLNHLHSQGLSHRELRPQNILVASRTSDPSQAKVKLLNCWMPTLKGDPDMKTIRNARISPIHLPPEMANFASGKEDAKYTEKSDMWSLGVLAYIMMCGFPPFYSENMVVMIQRIQNVDFDFPSPEWDKRGKEAKDFIKKCFQSDQSSRPSAADAINHTWVADPGSRGTEGLDIHINLKDYLLRHKAKKAKNVITAVARLGHSTKEIGKH
mmetsp:Transcript_28238/g.44052  ORF Transcript_28238/g.44052 Transcript_28238/m.44052 type:complete len:344 (-) Transcript_28238:138-1169(-)